MKLIKANKILVKINNKNPRYIITDSRWPSDDKFIGGLGYYGTDDHKSYKIIIEFLDKHKIKYKIDNYQHLFILPESLEIVS